MYVVSSDKDMLQLVDDKVLVLNPPKDNLIADAAKVEEILGVPPERVVDVMALRGDTIDNIPGRARNRRQRVGRVDQAFRPVKPPWIAPRKSRRKPIANHCKTIVKSCSSANAGHH